jgi:hypothetical protein
LLPAGLTTVRILLLAEVQEVAISQVKWGSHLVQIN